MLIPDQHAQATALAQCSRMGFTGLVTWSNEFEQLDVEAYFSTQPGVFNTAVGYWMGISRKADTDGPFASIVDGTAYSGPDMAYQPWSHWSWSHVAASAAGSGKDCVAALATHMFDRFVGDSSNERQLNDTNLYITSEDNQERKWGWQAVGCQDSLSAICVMPAAELQCASPPPPPKPRPPPVPSPPRPPSPPVPPLQHKCECRSALSCR
jgi:hypothetical protein